MKTCRCIRRKPAANSLNASLFFQPKLAAAEQDDIYEREANVANNVVDENAAAKNFFFKPVIRRLPQYNSMQEDSYAPPQTETYLSNIAGGHPLATTDKNFFEAKMGYDFSDVRIHTNTAAVASAKDIHALAYTSGNDIVFNEDQYKPNTAEGKKLLAHELTHVVQQNGNVPNKIQARRELDKDKESDWYTKCLAAINETITTLEANTAGMPDDIQEAIKLLRKKFTENKIKCYELDGIEHGITNFTTGEIYMDAKFLKDQPGKFANIGEGNLLHVGIHALHKEKYPKSTARYGQVLDDKKAGKDSNLTQDEARYLEKLRAWTEYWAYRKMREYNNVKLKQGKDEETIHEETLKRMKEDSGIGPLLVVWKNDKNWDPRKWKPKN